MDLFNQFFTGQCIEECLRKWRPLWVVMARKDFPRQQSPHLSLTAHSGVHPIDTPCWAWHFIGHTRSCADFHTHPSTPAWWVCLLLTRLNVPSLVNLLRVTETVGSDCRYQDFPLTLKSNSEFHRVTSLPAKSHQLNKVKFFCNKSAVNSYCRQER